MNQRVTDGALTAEEFEALPPKDQLFSLLTMIDRYLDGVSGTVVDPWHAAKIHHALEKINAGEVMAAAHDLALADQGQHGSPEAVLDDRTVDGLRKDAKEARKLLMA